MGRIKKIVLNAEQHTALENGYQSGQSHAFRRRCQMVLLKSQGRASSEVAAIVGGCEVVVNNWVHRYLEEGLAGLETKPGRGRKAMPQSHPARVRSRNRAGHSRPASPALKCGQSRVGVEFGQELLPQDVG